MTPRTPTAALPETFARTSDRCVPGRRSARKDANVVSADTAAYAPLVDGIEIHCPAYFVACACVKGKKFCNVNAFPRM